MTNFNVELTLIVNLLTDETFHSKEQKWKKNEVFLLFEFIANV